MEFQICLYALLFLLSQFVPAFSSLTQHLCRRDERVALLQFKEMFNVNESNGFSLYCDYSSQYSYPKISTWNKSTDCCTWDGVTCHKMTGHVIGLDLSCGRLEGAINPNSSLFELSQLEKLNLAFNDFKHSQISHGFGRFPRLMHLNLSNSNFDGQIASEISHLSKLVSLDLSWVPILPNLSKFSLDPFPFSILAIFLESIRFRRSITFGQHDFQLLLKNLTHISVLCLSDVDISSEIPSNLSSSLSYLDLSSTGVHGKLPNNVFQLPKLQTLRLSGNQNLTGSFPKFNHSMSPLQELDLSSTGVHGKLPNDVFQLPKLQTLKLSGNQNLTGSFPKFNCSMSSLQELDLSGTNFFGELPSSIGCLKSLKVLTLGNCQLSGPLPESIGNFSELISLGLSHNNFIEQIPTAISKLVQLRAFDLSNNQLEGQIPDSFMNLSKLSVLSLWDNNLVGYFPRSIVNLTELIYLGIMDNSIAGPLPSNVSGLQKLTCLSLANNLLNGTLPSWLFRLPQLLLLDLSQNQFTGQMDDFKGNSPMSLIILGNNQLNGPIPKSISKLLNLSVLDLSTNNLSGIIEPSMFLNLQNLGSLDLSDNRLQWRTENNVNISLPNLEALGLSSCTVKEFPNFLRRSKRLSRLYLSHNSLSSLVPIPWKTLEVLDLGFNQIQGPLPLSICNLDVLKILDLSNNQFTGAIPQCFGNFSSEILVLNLKNNRLQGEIALTFATNNKLGSLGLNGNFLEGSLPRSLANCEQLEVLDVGNNSISDMFPTWLESLKELKVLILKSNRFFGSISNLKAKNPFSNLRVFDVSNNEFDGVLPIELLKGFRAMMSVERNQSKARYMEIKFGDEDYYQESIHMVMKGLEFEFTKILTILTSIDMSSNRFRGEIPKAIGNLVFVRYLNFSHNRLSGHIPSTLGNLSSLESLDISCNQIEGEIPRQLALVTSLAFINLSQNHLVGRIPQGPQFNTFSNDSYKGNLGLCGSPLTMNCKENEVPHPLPHLIPQQEEDSDFFSGFTWQSVIMGYGCGIFLGVAVGTLMFLTRKPEKFVRFIEEEIYHCARFLSWKIHVHKSFGKPNRQGHKDRRIVH